MQGVQSTLYASSACKEEGEIGVETTIIVIVGLLWWESSLNATSWGSRLLILFTCMYK